MKPRNFYETADEFGQWFGEPPVERIKTIDVCVHGFSPEFLKQVEADLEMFEEKTHD